MRDFSSDLTIRDHIVLGNLLKDAREAYLALVSAARPKSSKLSSAIRSGLKDIEQLRWQLEDRLFGTVVLHRRDPRGLVTRVYYGEARLVRSADPGARADNDAFAGWDIAPQHCHKSDDA